ncbi:MAG: VOC family protein [Gemmataceae bacterium]
MPDKPRGIARLRLQTHRLAALSDFYSRTFGLPVIHDEPTSFTVQAGTTELTFSQAADENLQPHYHLAFNIPENKLLAAMAWLAERVSLTERGGSPVFDFPHWNAHAVYFFDPAGNLAEFISRHDLPNAAAGPFSAGDLLCASEIGIVVDDVPASAAKLKRDLGLATYRTQTATFEAVGDEHQLFIVVARGRVWFTTDDLRAGVYPTEVTFRGPAERECQLAELPYRIGVDNKN